ncbi:hypothetical protein VN0405_07980 [Helicobacter pylori]|nr:hypothetical protein VN0405_07980 [Helicobacter pylori]
MYHLQRYLTPDVLKERGLEFFDDWAKTYGEVVNDFELDTSAQSYKMVNRFSKFSDVQGLSTMYRAFVDIVSNDDILKHNPHFVPKVYGDKPINVVVKRSEEVAQFIGVADENGKYNEGSIISMSEELTHKKLKEQNKQIAEQNKEKLDAIKKQFASNLNDLFFNEETDCKLLEYKGFVVNAYKTKYQVEFSLSPKDNPNIAYSPSNMVYKNDTANMFSSYNFCGEIKFDGFLKRLDNATTKLPEKIKELENSIKTTQENIVKYTRLVDQKPPYPRLEYLQALKWDHKTLIDDLAKMSKDRDYKPVFNPKSQEVLEKMNAEKRASLENESLTEEIKEQANQEAHRPMKKASGGDYAMGM